MTTGPQIDLKRRVGDNLRQALIDHDMTMSELARRLEVGERQISRWRDGETFPRPEQMVRISAEFETDPGWFYNEHGPEAAA